jgi:hypothetical protein
MMPHDKDAIIRSALGRLTRLVPSSAWRDASEPYTALRAECLVLASDSGFVRDLKRYLTDRSILRRSIVSFFTHISMAARAKWDDAPPDIRPIVARGWFLGRWLPTFLVIDGPVGRFLSGSASPLAARLGSSLPVLTAARDLLAEKSFRSLRNGFAHWGFDWEVVGKESYVVAYDWERDLPIAKLHQEEADAFHICAYSLIEVIDDVLISERAFHKDAL